MGGSVHKNCRYNEEEHKEWDELREIQEEFITRKRSSHTNGKTITTPKNNCKHIVRENDEPNEWEQAEQHEAWEQSLTNKWEDHYEDCGCQFCMTCGCCPTEEEEESSEEFTWVDEEYEPTSSEDTVEEGDTPEETEEGDPMDNSSQRHQRVVPRH